MLELQDKLNSAIKKLQKLKHIIYDKRMIINNEGNLETVSEFVDHPRDKWIFQTNNYKQIL